MAIDENDARFLGVTPRVRQRIIADPFLGVTCESVTIGLGGLGMNIRVAEVPSSSAAQK